MANTFELLGKTSVTGSGSVTTMSLTGIPSTYTDLVLYIKSRAETTVTYAIVDFETGGTFNRVRIQQASTTQSVLYQGNTNQGHFTAAASSNATTGAFGYGVLYFANYADTSPAVRQFGGLGVASTVAGSSSVMVTGHGAANLMNGFVISTIRVICPSSQTWLAGSSLHLYGVKSSQEIT